MSSDTLNLITTLDFDGTPIILAPDDFIGIYLSDDYTSSVVTTFTGAVFGRT